MRSPPGHTNLLAACLARCFFSVLTQKSMTSKNPGNYNIPAANGAIEGGKRVRGVRDPGLRFFDGKPYEKRMTPCTLCTLYNLKYLKKKTVIEAKCRLFKKEILMSRWC
jgi:hypothetical protein